MLSGLGRIVRARPKTIVVIALILLVLGAATGGYLYVLAQWEAAQTAVQNEQPEEALRRVEICLWLWPNDLRVRLLAARAARLSGDLEAADSHLHHCLKLERTEAVQLELLLLRVQRGEVSEVVPLLEARVEGGHPESALILETLARSYMHHLRYRPAFETLTRWIALEPRAAKPYQWRGWVYERLSHAQRAMEDYLRALELAPDLFAVRIRVAEMLLEDNRPLEALPHLKRARAQFADKPEVAARLGHCLFLQGDPVAARPLLEAAEKQLPKDIPVLVHLGKLELQEGRPAKAEELLRRALSLDLSETEARYTLVQVLRLTRRTEEADRELERYYEYRELVDRTNKLLRQESTHPTTAPDPASEIGRLLLRIGRGQLGSYWLHEALQRDPNHQASHQALAEFYELKGDRQNAAYHRRHLHDKKDEKTIK